MYEIEDERGEVVYQVLREPTSESPHFYPDSIFLEAVLASQQALSEAREPEPAKSDDDEEVDIGSGVEQEEPQASPITEVVPKKSESAILAKDDEEAPSHAKEGIFFFVK